MVLHTLHKLVAVTYNYTTTTSSTGSSVGGLVLVLVLLALAVFLVAAMWKVFQKAGKPGWASIVPVYNLWVLFEIAGKPGWWSLLALIPFVNIVVIVLEIIALIEVGKRFGKSPVWSFFLLFLLSFIGWPILGFGKAQYQGNAPGGGAPVDANSVPTASPVPPTNPEPQTFEPPVSTPPTAQEEPAPPADQPPAQPPAGLVQ